MTRAVLFGVLAGLLLCAGSSLAQTGSSRSLRSSDRDHRVRDRDQDSDHRPGYWRRGAPERLPMYRERDVRRDDSRHAKRSRNSFRERRHAATCGCSPCRSTRRDTTVVVLSSNDRRAGDSVVVLREGRQRRDRGYPLSVSHRHGLEHGYGWNRSTERTQHDLSRAVQSTRLRRHADPDCREPGTVLASSGSLYVQVRADGRLTIRSR